MSESPGNKHGIVVQPTEPLVLVEHRARIRALEANQTAKPDGIWHVIGAVGEPPWENGFSDGGDGQPSAAFMITATGRLFFRGCVTGGADGAVVFTLPVGFRPVAQEPFVTYLKPRGIARWRVYPTGSVVLEQRVV